MTEHVVTRFAPSPTGFLHAGNYRTAVFAYLFARRHRGEFIVRIEDTDTERSKPEYEAHIFESLAWLGLEEDARYRQSTHRARHEEELRRLIGDGMAYVSKETPQREGDREEVIRFRNPNTILTFTDAIRGEISFDTTELGDFIVAKSVTEPVFHFAVVVDDWDEGVTHVIRGEDHISNTPRHILIGKALGAPLPIYAHLPLILGADRSKLSKRKGAQPLLEYRALGFIPEAVLNYTALLGWHPPEDKEVLSKQELIENFDLSRVQKGGAGFDEEKMRWFNHEHLKKLSTGEYAARLGAFVRSKGEPPPDYLLQAAALLQERAKTLLEAQELLRAGECSFFEHSADYDADVLLRGAKAERDTVAKHLDVAAELLRKVANSAWSAESVKEVIFPYATEVGRSAVLWPLRVALSGLEKSPDPFTMAGLIGKKETLVRIAAARTKL